MWLPSHTLSCAAGRMLKHTQKIYASLELASQTSSLLVTISRSGMAVKAFSHSSLKCRPPTLQCLPGVVAAASYGLTVSMGAKLYMLLTSAAFLCYSLELLVGLRVRSQGKSQGEEVRAGRQRGMVLADCMEVEHCHLLQIAAERTSVIRPSAIRSLSSKVGF